jgi:hypothetical protein
MTTDSDFWWNWSVQVGVAIGTLLAVVAAIFGEAIRARLFKPKLRLELSSSTGIRVPMVMVAPEGTQRKTESHWFHVKVINAGSSARWPAAIETRVMLLRAEVLDASGHSQSVWSGAVPLRWSHHEFDPLPRTIGPEAECDLCSVVKDKWIALHPLIPQSDFEWMRRNAVHWRLTLQARSVEVDSPVLVIAINWDGSWSDDPREMSKHLGVKVLQTPVPS